MGIIIFPLYLGAIAIVLKSAFMISEQFKNSSFESTSIAYGIAIMLFIYGLIVLSYRKEKKPWGLSPLFRFPLFMIYIPFVITCLINNFVESNLSQISDSLLICIVASGLFIVIFNNYTFNILAKLGKEKHY